MARCTARTLMPCSTTSIRNSLGGASENDGRATQMIDTQKDLEKFENGRTWRKLSAKVRADNPICQFVDPDTGEQCRYPSTVVHHLVDPRDCNELALAVYNLVACCANHHPGGHRGDHGRADYAPTRHAPGFGQPEVLYHHAPARVRANPQTDINPAEFAAIAVKEAQARAEWLAWKTRQTQATAAEKTLSTEANPPTAQTPQ